MAFNPRQIRDPRTGRWMRMGGAVSNPMKGKLEVFPTTPGKPFRRRGSGAAGFKRNLVPYIRVNKRGQTVGVNTGSYVAPHHRVAIGGYARLEDTRKVTPFDVGKNHIIGKFAPKGTKRAKTVKFLRHSVKITNPAIRYQHAGVQARLGTSRYGGPTIIIRRGAHKTSWDKSRAGVQKYDRRMAAIRGEKAKFERTRKRQQRRKQARKLAKAKKRGRK